ncbi:unnamed protein product [Urochloa humidicola]
MEAVLALCLCVAAAALMLSPLGGAAGEGAAATAQELRRGFTATHDESYWQFQPVLADPNGAFALGFLRVNGTMLDLAVLHLPSAFPLWRAIPDRPAPWSAAATLSFDDGGLALTDRAANKVLWSTAAASSAAGDRAVLLNTSNLQIQSAGAGVVWQSFDYPSDTIVQGQNFTSAAALRSSDRRFAMRLGSNYFALYAEPPVASAAAMYFKHTALEAKAQIVAGGGPAYARVEPDGYLAMYQKEGPPADVLSFDTFNRGVRALRRMTLEPDGNLRAYYWVGDGGGGRWALDYTAIDDRCELPTTCGAYAVCSQQPGGACQCLLGNATTDGSGSGCAAAAADAAGSGGGGGLCGTTGGEVGGLYTAVRRRGVEPVNKELLGFERAVSAGECEARCERNCSCWGAVFSNGTGYCYLMDYPAQLLVEGDERKVGYFKVRSMGEEEGAAGRGRGSGGGGRGVKAAMLAVGGAAVAGAAAFGAYRVWERRRRRRREGADARRQMAGAGDDGLSPGPYKNLGSFSSVELTNSFRR